MQRCSMATITYSIGDWLEDRRSGYLFRIIGMFSAKGNRYVNVSLIGKTFKDSFNVLETKAHRTYTIEALHKKYKLAPAAQILYGAKSKEMNK